MHSRLVDAAEAFLWKIHTFGVQSISPEDIRDMDNAVALEKGHHDETQAAIEEFVDAMNSPRGDAADVRRSRALSRLRAARSEIQKNREANDGRLRIDAQRQLP